MNQDDKMRIDIITVMPEMLTSPLNTSILKRAQDKGLVDIVIHDLRDYSQNKHRRVDDYPFGGEAGMVMQIEPVDRAISHLKSQRDYDEVIFTSPDGEVLNQPMANALSLSKNLIILCGHYKGIDYRIREHLITKEISIGDYVVTGGEMPAMILADAVSRMLPGVLSQPEGYMGESHYSSLLEYPQYTKPPVWHDVAVPEVLTSGHHANINKWQRERAIERTYERRPELLENADLTKKEKLFLEELKNK
jgi:tRNA (guanine37-N1)-methyltransferase